MAVNHITLEEGKNKVNEVVKPGLAKPLVPGRWMATIKDESNNSLVTIPFLISPIVQNNSAVISNASSKGSHLVFISQRQKT